MRTPNGSHFGMVDTIADVYGASSPLVELEFALVQALKTPTDLGLYLSYD